MRIVERVQQGEDYEFGFDGDGTLMQGSEVCVSDVDNLRNKIMQEAYYTPYSIHLGCTKMYYDVKDRSDQLSLVEFAYNNSYHYSIEMAPYKALYGRKCWSPLCWTEVGEARVHDVDLMQYTSDMVLLIKEHLKTTCSRQKSYADPRRKDIKVIMGDYVFLNVSPMKGVMRFGKKGKLAPHYIGHFEITDKVGAVAYQLKLLPNLSHVHLVFHISMLTKYVLDPSHVL
ncbi:uncharacterized protein LOC110642974 [Hevea brasiliensis]|uniref:uncharacterized protein LOC110642974 n=1 Tax=Hevea brasiliensis TaxID=3981 RepID=UPI0025E050FE|nr:uncharacterized protein LOC110642974 [Hevea brasiliensis]